MIINYFSTKACTSVDCYITSKKKGQVCKPLFSKEISVIGHTGLSFGYVILALFLGSFILFLTRLLNHLQSHEAKPNFLSLSRKVNLPDIIPKIIFLGLSATMFGLPVYFLQSRVLFNVEYFCIVNSYDPICLEAPNCIDIMNERRYQNSNAYSNNQTGIISLRITKDDERLACSFKFPSNSSVRFLKLVHSNINFDNNEEFVTISGKDRRYLQSVNYERSDINDLAGKYDDILGYTKMTNNALELHMAEGELLVDWITEKPNMQVSDVNYLVIHVTNYSALDGAIISTPGLKLN